MKSPYVYHDGQRALAGMIAVLFCLGMIFLCMFVSAGVYLGPQ